MATLQAESRLSAYLYPAQILLIGFLQIPTTIYRVAITERHITDLFSFSKFHDDFFASVWFLLGPEDEKDFAEEKHELTSSCHEIVIEIGPGLGASLRFLDRAKIQHIYGVEPNVKLHPRLRKRIEEFGFQDLYTIVPCGIEDKAGLERYGVPREGVDCVLSVQVLCGVPEPKSVLRGIWEVLKPGGQFLMFEHVRSKDYWTAWVQWGYDLIWWLPFGGCKLTRPVDEWLVDGKVMGWGVEGGWETVELSKGKGQTIWSCLPRAYGRLVKKRSV